MEARIAKTMPTHKRKPNLRRNATHLAFVRSLKICLCCGARGPVDAAHVRNGSDAGASLKPSDRFTVPLCRTCHMNQHSTGEVTFWGNIKVDAMNVCLRLWTVSNDADQGIRVIERSLLTRGLAQ